MAPFPRPARFPLPELTVRPGGALTIDCVGLDPDAIALELLGISADVVIGHVRLRLDPLSTRRIEFLLRALIDSWTAASDLPGFP